MSKLRSRELWLETRLHVIEEEKFNTEDRDTLSRLTDERSSIMIELADIRLKLYSAKPGPENYVGY